MTHWGVKIAMTHSFLPKIILNICVQFYLIQKEKNKIKERKKKTKTPTLKITSITTIANFFYLTWQVKLTSHALYIIWD